MKHSIFVNIVITLYVTALFIFFQPIVFPFDLTGILNTIGGDSYYISLLFRFILFYIFAQFTMTFVYYFVDHRPHHPDM